MTFATGQVLTTPWGPLAPLPATKVRELVFVRHGQTTANRDGIAQGWIEYPLSDLGIAQATQTAKALAEWPFDAVYSSPLGRAAQTAVILAAPHALRVQWVDDLREVHVGAMAGRTWAEFALVFPEEAARYQAADALPWAFRKDLIPGREPAMHLLYRAWRALQTILLGDAERLLVVSHGDLLSVLLSQLLDGDAGNGDWRYELPNCGIAQVTLSETGARLARPVHTLGEAPRTESPPVP